MVKKVFQKMAAMLMAFVLLLSTFSWTVEKHLCLGHVKDIAFFASAKPCCALMQSIAEEQEKSSKSSCCDDEIFTFQGQDELAKADAQFDLSPLEYQIPASYFFSNTALFALKIDHSSNWYPPPIAYKNRNILYEVFLI